MPSRTALLAFLLCAVVSAQQMTSESETAFVVGFDSARLHTEQVPYTDGTTSLRGYLAYDNSSAQSRPAVVILPDWDGIGPYEEWRAHLLATLGYTALVADIYGADVQQGPSLPMARRQELTRTFSTNPELYVERIHAALDVVRGLETVDPARLAAIGYCFGGGGVIHLHRSYPNNTEGLLGIVGFHSSLPSTFANDAVPNNPIRTLFFNGYNDQGAGPADVADFEASLNATNASWAFVQLGQTVHAFTEPTMDIVATNTPQTNGGYNPIGDRFSWWSLRGFLRDVFGAADASNPYTDEVTLA